MISIARTRFGKNGINVYEVFDDYVVFYYTNPKGKSFEIKFSLCDLDRILALDGKVFARYNWSNEQYYASITRYEGQDENGKSINRNIRLHTYIMETAGSGHMVNVDHINHDTLDNRRENLRIVEARHNSSNRKGANKNSGTGVRNVNYIKKCDQYWVQIMKDGIRHKWEFPSDQFEEACKFAELKRKEIFGEYAGCG